MIAAERALKRKHALRKAAEDSDGDGAEGDSDDDEKHWGAGKDKYYDAEDVDVDVRALCRSEPSLAFSNDTCSGAS